MRGASGLVKFALVVVLTAIAGVIVGLYVTLYLKKEPPAVAAAAVPAAHQAHLTLQTVASIGHGPTPDWVSYYARNPQEKWVHSTILRVPAHSLVTVTVYQFDTATGLRNPLFGQPRGVVNGVMTVDGKSYRYLNPDDASHTFAVPDLGISVPLKGVADNAPNQCSYAPCGLDKAHHAVTFRFRTGAPGTFRWQCFVPCAAGFIFGNGGPMQSLGYMDGLLQAV